MRYINRYAAVGALAILGLGAYMQGCGRKPAVVQTQPQSTSPAQPAPAKPQHAQPSQPPSDLAGTVRGLVGEEFEKKYGPQLKQIEVAYTTQNRELEKIPGKLQAQKDELGGLIAALETKYENEKAETSKANKAEYERFGKELDEVRQAYKALSGDYQKQQAMIADLKKRLEPLEERAQRWSRLFAGVKDAFTQEPTIRIVPVTEQPGGVQGP